MKKNLTDFAWPSRFCNAAVREGWNMFDSAYGREVQRDDERKLFASDDEALAFVAGRAWSGAQHARRALEIQADYCTCHAHDEVVCPGGDCDGCEACPTGAARRYLNALPEQRKRRKSMSLQKAVYSRRHFLNPNDNRRGLCGMLPATLAQDPTTYPRKVDCARCVATLQRIAASMDALGKGLYKAGERNPWLQP